MKLSEKASCVYGLAGVFGGVVVTGVVVVVVVEVVLVELDGGALDVVGGLLELLAALRSVSVARTWTAGGALTVRTSSLVGERLSV
jgi:hypothetical protein